MITCWEVGRRLAEQQPALAEATLRGEFPPAGWKGGVEKGTKLKKKVGTLRYLAQWQGLRGDNLDIDLEAEAELECSATGVLVCFTNNSAKYSNA